MRIRRTYHYKSLLFKNFIRGIKVFSKRHEQIIAVLLLFLIVIAFCFLFLQSALKLNAQVASIKNANEKYFNPKI